jgi:glyceraldehyde 3-phosphate dehydrogenase
MNMSEIRDSRFNLKNILGFRGTKTSDLILLLLYFHTPIMVKRTAINGCGRIGRLALRLAWQQADDFTIVHLNDVAAIESVAYLIQYDSVHGTWGVKVKADSATGNITFTEGARTLSVKYTQSKVLADLKEEYTAAKVELVLECTGEILSLLDGTDLALSLYCAGVYLNRKALQPYFDMGVKKVVVSAPVKDPVAVLNIVYGVNHDQYKADVDHIVTAASCTTNCLAPVVKVVLDKLGIKHGCITTIHNITNTQTVVDSVNAKKDDLRRARSGMVNLAPTSTGSATAIALIFPELKGKLNGLAVRVPLTNAR